MFRIAERRFQWFLETIGKYQELDSLFIGN